MYKRLYIILGLMLAVIVVLIITLISGSNLINNLNLSITGKAIDEPDTNVSCIVYDNQDPNNIKSLVTINNDGGIDYIINPEGTKILVNGKQKVAVDYNTEMNTANTFEIKLINSEIINKIINITQEDINNSFEMINVSTNDEYTEYDIDYKMKDAIKDKIYYKIGEKSETWINFENKIKLNVLDIENTVDNSLNKGMTTVYLKKMDSVGNIVYAYKTCEINSTVANLYDDIKHKGKTIDQYNIQYTAVERSNTAYNATKISAGATGGSSNRGNWSGYYTFPLNQFNFNNIGKIHVDYTLKGEYYRIGGTYSIKCCCIN